MKHLHSRQSKNSKFEHQQFVMPAIAIKKVKSSPVAEVKKMRDYSKESVFKKKIEKAKAFLEKNGLPDAFTKSK